MTKLVLFSLFALFFIFVSCSDNTNPGIIQQNTTQQQHLDPPTTQSQNTSIQTNTSPEKVLDCSIEKLTYPNYNLYLINNGTNIFLYNCGDEVWAPIIATELLRKQVDTFTIVISNSSSLYLGACEMIILNFPRLDKIVILDNENYTKYKLVADYALSSKIVFDDTYHIPCHNNTISLFNITNNITRTDGLTYE